MLHFLQLRPFLSGLVSRSLVSELARLFAKGRVDDELPVANDADLPFLLRIPRLGELVGELTVFVHAFGTGGVPAELAEVLV